MKYRIIRTTNGGHAIIDPEDYERVSQHRWFTNSAGYAYRQGWSGPQKTTGQHWTVWMHREINKTPDGLFTDHINGNKCDNRKANLRTVDKCWNSTNRPKIKVRKPTSPYKGVSFHPSTGLWRARAKHGKWERTTYHKAEQQAALDYNRMAQERFGEYAQLNALPEGIEPTVRRAKTSLFRGVGFHKKSERWRATIDIDGKTTTIGAYQTELEAAIAYNDAAKKIHGERAILNRFD